MPAPSSAGELQKGQVMDVDKAVRLVEAEYIKATEEFGKFHSAHEGFSIFDEERDELWDEVKHKPRDVQKMRHEATQVAAMAIRFLVDCC